MRRILGTLALATALAVAAGCGATDWKTSEAGSAAQKQAAATKAAQVAKAKKTTAAEARYVSALVASNGPSPSAGAAAEVRCVATAIVRTYGVQAFEAAALSPNALRAPNSSLTALPTPTAAQDAAMGASLQHCGIGKAVAQGLAEGLKSADPATVACLGRQMDKSAAAHRFLVAIALDRAIDLAAAHGVLGVIAACVDLPTLVLRTAGLGDLDPTTRACVVSAVRSSTAGLKDYLAAEIAGKQSDESRAYLDSLGVAINHCRPSARTGFTVPAG
jgi:hypothetical protein